MYRERPLISVYHNYKTLHGVQIQVILQEDMQNPSYIYRSNFAYLTQNCSHTYRSKIVPIYKGVILHIPMQNCPYIRKTTVRRDTLF